MAELKMESMTDVAMAAMIDLEKHLDSHNCDVCLKKYGVFLKGMEAWVESGLSAESLQTMKGAIDAKESQKEGAQQDQGEQAQSEAKGEEDWNIFK